MNKESKHKSSYGEDCDKEFNVSYFPHKSGTYRIEIDDNIDSVSQFSTAIQVLGVAKEDDDVEIHLQSNGGSVDACGAFLHAMRKCAAPIHTVATGGCHSAATHILLQSDSFELASNFNSLVHCGSVGAFGTLSEYNSKTAFDREFVADMYRKIYEGFFDPEELEAMLQGKDVWLNTTTWMERYNKRNEYFLAKEAAANAPAKKPRKRKAAVKAVPDEE